MKNIGHTYTYLFVFAAVVVCGIALSGCSGRIAPIDPAAGAIDISAPITTSNVYVVKSGDTLRLLSENFYGTPDRWELLYYANTDVIDAPQDLVAGVSIYIPSKDVSAMYEYSVQPGDNLSRIALKFYSDRSKAEVIAKYNRLKDPDHIVPGQKLLVPVLR